ncbi:hypothetical protein BRN45_10640 [Xanthomonas oryzae pv. oryzae]|nr:hypothetical protein BRN45_10640 [Xanthomonas oryzae pv. oryzae]
MPMVCRWSSSRCKAAHPHAVPATQDTVTLNDMRAPGHLKRALRDRLAATQRLSWRLLTSARSQSALDQ